MITFVRLAFLFNLFSIVCGEYRGVDVSTLTTPDTANCFVSNGISFIIPRGYRSSGTLDPNVCSTLTNSQQAGIKYRDVYIFPCPTCSISAQDQMTSLVSYLKSSCPSAWSGRVWLDIEGSQYWLGDYTKNQEWFKTLVDACKVSSPQCGIYASKSQWSAIFGSTSFSYGNDLPLWYPHYDNNPTFSDFTTFGGFQEPFAKQYYNTNTICGQGVDLNYALQWDELAMNSTSLLH